MTAGHCLDWKTDIAIAFGITATGEWRQKMIAPPSNQYIYPNYAKWIYMHDIGLIKLPSPITFNEFIQPVAFTHVCETPHMGGQDVITAGMGYTSMEKPLTSNKHRLRHARLVTMPSKHCSQQSANRKNPDTIICVLSNGANGQSAYKGDSGRFFKNSKLIFFLL